VNRWTVAGAAVVVLLLLGYPLATLAGGSPRFPDRSECARVATATDSAIEVVYGRFDEVAAAETLLADVTKTGFVGAELKLDACARWKVSYDRVDAFDQAEALAEQVRAAGFEARVELER
jgi:hypothetical protein